QLAGGREEMDAAVSVAVGYVEITPRTDREVRGPVEGATGPLDGRGVLAVVAGVRRCAHGAEGHQELALRSETPHGVVAVVAAVERAVRRDGDAMRAQGEEPLPPRPQEVAFLIVREDRVVAAADQIDSVLAVDGDPRDVAVRVALRQLLPALDHRIIHRPPCPHRYPPLLTHPPALTRAGRRGVPPSPCSYPRYDSVGAGRHGGAGADRPRCRRAPCRA